MTAVLITGAAGRIGRVLRAGLAGRYPLVRVLDVAVVTAEHPGEEAVVADVRDDGALAAAMDGVDVVVHLAGIPEEAPFEEILAHNVDGTYRVFEAARRHGARRVVFASSSHVVGFYPTSQVVGPSDEIRPDTYYGVSKAFGEALGRLYHDKWALEVVCLRIGSFRSEPGAARELSTWLSQRDCVALVQAAIEAPSVGFVVLYGVSDNRRRWWDNAGADEAIGYAPRDDAEAFADRFGPDADPGEHHGGTFTRPDLPAPR